MNTALSYLLLITVLVAPFALIAFIAHRAHREGHLRWHLDQFRSDGPLVGRLFGDDDFRDSDLPRIDHDLDAVRTRFEHHPAWPDSGVRGERR